MKLTMKPTLKRNQVGTPAFPIVSGGEVTDVTVGSDVFRVHAFKTVGNTAFTVDKEGAANVLVVAGGGGGGGSAGAGASGAGGGAGGLIFEENRLISPGSYTATVGSGGAGVPSITDAKGGDGSNSSIFGLAAIGGGGGGARAIGSNNGGSGGGAGSQTTGTWGTGVSGQGYRGGDTGFTGSATADQNSSGGGGGATSIGGKGDDNAFGGSGGRGFFAGYWFGTSVGASGSFSGGGGGGTPGEVADAAGRGGVGGGADGGDHTGLNAQPNTGGGGGGAGADGASGDGGSGIILISYKIGKSDYLTSIRKAFDYLSQQDAATLGWVSPESNMNGTVEAYTLGTDCSNLMTFEQAMEYAHSRGGRLPTLEEVRFLVVKATGCGYDAEPCWTCDKADEGGSAHYTTRGDGLGSTQVHPNSLKAYARPVADTNLDRPDPMRLQDPVSHSFLVNNGYM